MHYCSLHSLPLSPSLKLFVSLTLSNVWNSQVDRTLIGLAQKPSVLILSFCGVRRYTSTLRNGDYSEVIMFLSYMKLWNSQTYLAKFSQNSDVRSCILRAHSHKAQLPSTVPKHDCPTSPVPCWPALTLLQVQPGLNRAWAWLPLVRTSSRRDMTHAWLYVICCGFSERLLSSCVFYPADWMITSAQILRKSLGVKRVSAQYGLPSVSVPLENF